jgi:hypothetical protein
MKYKFKILLKISEFISRDTRNHLKMSMIFRTTHQNFQFPSQFKGLFKIHCSRLNLFRIYFLQAQAKERRSIKYKKKEEKYL